MNRIDCTLIYLGKVYHDINGVTYYHFRIKGLIGDGAILCIPVDAFKGKQPKIYENWMLTLRFQNE